MTARRFAFIAGSGMDPLARVMTARREVRFDDIAGVGACGVEGHVGRVLEGTVGGRECTLVVGRRHVYEGDPAAVAHLVAWLADSGITDLVMASAAGGLHRGAEPGDLVIARDIIDIQNREYLARRVGGRQEPAQGATTHPTGLRIDRALAAEIERAATAARVRWQRGTIVCGVGPAYETPAEVRVFQDWGDTATMSAAPELVAASWLGLRAAAIALVTNPCTGVASSRPNHTEVLEAGRRMVGGLGDVIQQLIAM